MDKLRMMFALFNNKWRRKIQTMSNFMMSL